MTVLSYRSRWARRLVDEAFSLEAAKRQHHDAAWFAINRGNAGGKHTATPPSPSVPEDRGLSQDLHICIIGAGVSGLYTAMILDSLDIPNLTYDILESDTRPGGRLFTYAFSNTPYDYVDMGAMRYPRMAIMKRVFQLFRMLEIPLVEYHLDGTGCPAMFNNVLASMAQREAGDPFRFGISKGGMVPDALIAQGATTVLETVFQPWKAALSKDFDAAFPQLLELDRYSTAQYLEEALNFDYHTIQWLETTSSATGLFNQSFVESVLDWIDFGTASEWACIDGGSRVLVDRMMAKIRRKPCFNKRVASLGQSPYGIHVDVSSTASESRLYDAVFCTNSLPSLEFINTDNINFHPVQRTAIRTLHYDSSVKIAIKFDHPWWHERCGIQGAGTSRTDRPLHTCIYPSYGLKDGHSQSNVLLCSYTWAQDAQRISSLVRDSSPTGEEQLRDLVLYELSQMHKPHITLEELRRAYVTHYAFSWDRDPNQGGAFALFSPSQFSSLYPYLTLPAADGRLFLVGEAASAHHGWLLGSLDSAYRGVSQLLHKFGMPEYQRKLRQLWGPCGEASEDTIEKQVLLSM